MHAESLWLEQAQSTIAEELGRLIRERGKLESLPRSSRKISLLLDDTISKNKRHYSKLRELQNFLEVCGAKTQTVSRKIADS